MQVVSRIVNIPNNNNPSVEYIEDCLKNLNINCGWSSLRYCSYPQMIITQLSSMSDIKEIDIDELYVAGGLQR